jgi:hypothetical protein
MTPPSENRYKMGASKNQKCIFLYKNLRDLVNYIQGFQQLIIEAICKIVKTQIIGETTKI